MDHGMYGFPKQRQKRPLKRRFTRYFDAFQFGSPVLWWCIDFPILNNQQQIIGFYDKSGNDRVALGGGQDIQQTSFGPSVYVYNNSYTYSANPVTGNNPRTIVLVTVGNHSATGQENWWYQTVKPFWQHGNFYITYRHRFGYAVQNDVYSDTSGVLLSLGWFNYLSIIGLRYTGSVLHGYVNGSLVGSNTVSPNTTTGSVGLGSYQYWSWRWTWYSAFWFYECVMYDDDVGDSHLQRISGLLQKQYTGML